MSRRRFICRCTPSLGRVSIYWVKAMEDIGWPMNTVKASMFMEDVAGGEIAECRNLLVTKVLHVEATHGDWSDDSAIFWLDDDVLTTAGVLQQLTSHNRDIVTGVYFLKSDPTEPLIFPTLGGGTSRYVPAGDNKQKTQEAWMGSCGLSLVRTSVYRRLRDELKLPLDKNGNPEWYKTTAGRADAMIVENGVMSKGGTEDAYFAGLAHSFGYSMLVDLTKYAFGFHFDAKTRWGYPKAQWEQRQAGKPVTWPQPDGTEIVWT